MEESNYNELIIKFLSQEITESELEELRVWLEKDPANRHVFDEENALWHESGIKTKFDYFKTDDAWSEISEKIGIGRKRKENVAIIGKYNFRFILAAASFLLIVALGSLTLWSIERKEGSFVPTIAKVSTDAGEKARVFLCDSTMVIINSGSTLEYSSSYNTIDRVVRLTGEAFFDVATNPAKPFIVQAGDMKIIARGTKFNVFSYENEDRVEATLEEGDIVISLNDGRQLNIKKDQQMIYFPKSNKILLKEVSTETYTSWKENKLRLVDATFDEAIRQISRRYNVVFEVKGKELLDLRYTATFIDESIEDVMEMLKEISPIKYKIYKCASINHKEYIKPKIYIERINKTNRKTSIHPN